MKKVMLVAGMVSTFLVAQTASAVVIYSDDFSTDPAGNWTQVLDDGNAAINWDSGTETVQLDHGPGGNGFVTYWTTATTAADASLGYHVDIDFMLKASRTTASMSIGARLQRQGDNSHYRIRGFRGGDGAVLWRSDGGNLTQIDTIDPTFNGQITAGQWYTYHAEVLDTGSQIELRAVIYDQGTTNVAVPWSLTAVDNSGSRLTTNSGFGFQIGGVIHEDSDFINVDNFVVTQIPEPATLALLASGGLCCLRRRK